MKQSIKMPREVKYDVIDQIVELGRLADRDAFTRAILTYFTTVDLILIRDELAARMIGAGE